MKKAFFCFCLLACVFVALASMNNTSVNGASSPSVPSSGQMSAATIAHPHTRQQFIDLARQDATQAGIQPDTYVRQINEESGFQPLVVSPAGAIGIAQFMPSTAAGLGINPWDPVASLRGAAQLMARYLHNYGGNYAKALAAYNAGSGRLQQAINDCGDSWQSCLPAETRNYIHIILQEAEG